MDCEFIFEEGLGQLLSLVMFGNSFMKEKVYSNCQLEVSFIFIIFIYDQRLSFFWDYNSINFNKELL